MKVDTKSEPKRCQFCHKELPAHPGRGRRSYCPPSPGEKESECFRQRRLEQVGEAVENFRRKLPEEVRKAQYRAYKFLSREGLTRERLLDDALPLSNKQTDTNTVDEGAIWQELKDARKAVLVGDDLAIAKANKLRALLIGRDTAFARRALLYCEEILRDAGEYGEFRDAFTGLDTRCTMIVGDWVIGRDYLPLTTALVTLGNFYRSRLDLSPGSNIRRAADYLDGAIDVATGLCQWENRHHVNLVVHQASLYRFSLVAFNARQPDEAQKDLERLNQLASEIDTRHTWAETWLARMAYNTLMGNIDEAWNCFQEAVTSLASVPACSPYIEIRILRQQVELLMKEKHREDEAAAKIRECAETWHKHRSFYHFRLLETWQDKYPKLVPQFKRARPIYAAAMIPGFYAEDRLLKL